MLYILKRLLYSIITLFVIVTITFALMHTVPGGPFIGEKKLPDNIVKNLEAKYGLDKPIYVQYYRYVTNALKGDLGQSLSFRSMTVSDMIKKQFPISMKLGLVAVAIALVLGTALGIISALRHGHFVDRAAMVIATIGSAVPSFVVASVCMIFFGILVKDIPILSWLALPTRGLEKPENYILPAFALSFFPLSFIARLMRSSMLDVINQDYIRTARAKGLKESMVIFKHAVRNAILPVVTYMGPLLAAVLTGSFVVEKIFTIPGLGLTFVKSISSRDYSVILGVTIFYGAFLIAMNFLVDISYALIDPRIKVKE